LFAALNYLDEKILSRTETRHTHVEWLRFLKQIDQKTLPDQQPHLIVDNYATHLRRVRRWIPGIPRDAGIPILLDIRPQNSYADFCFIKHGLNSVGRP